MRYAELHCRTNFSFLEGASHPDELVVRAAELGYAALAVTDRNSLAGVVRAYAAAKDVGLKLVIGAEITPADAPPVVLWAMDRAGYGRLARLITVGRRRAAKGECELTLDDVAGHAEGLMAGVVAGGSCNTPLPSGERLGDGRSCHRLPLTPALSPEGRGSVGIGSVGISLREMQFVSRSETATFHQYRDLFPDRCYLLAELHRGPDDGRRLEELIALSRHTRIPLVAAGDVRYHTPARMPLFDVLTAVRHGTTVDQAGPHLLPNAERHLRTWEEIAAAFAAAPDALRRTLEIADRCRFSLAELRYEYPHELAPPGLTPMEHLTRLTWQGAAERYPGGVPDKVRGLIEHELRLIEELRYEAFFLTVWDLVRFARSRGILCQGRGSAANSAVCYCLGVTAVDPDQADVLFERFVSRERDEAPDIDVDFEHERREEVLQYLYDKYGRERAGIAAEVIRYRSRSAVRDVGKALGLSLDRVDALAKQVEGYEHEPRLAEHCRQVGLDPDSDLGRRLIYLVNELIGFPRHLSQHVGGMVITEGPLCELVPIENAAMGLKKVPGTFSQGNLERADEGQEKVPGTFFSARTVVQWDKDDLDELGILKVDCLALGMLTAIRKCFELVEETQCGLRNAECGIEGKSSTKNSAFRIPNSEFPQLTLASVPPEDPRVYDMICRADTIGVFQIESRAQMSMLPRLRPRCYYDLVIEVAIVRPGPIQGQMVHPYLRRREKLEPVTYPNEAIREVLHKTLGVPIFQEQAMRLAVVAAGFTPGEADQLRRAMGAWRRPGIIDQFQRKLIEGMLARGLSQQFAESVFRQIRGFGEYGFPESHAASFAKLVYVSAWLKCHHQAAFTAAILNSQPMGFYAPAQLVRDARQHGVEVRGVDVNHSRWDCTLEVGENSECGIRNSELNTTSGYIIPHSEFRIPHSLRLGFRQISGLPRAAAEAIEAARRHSPFRSLEDFARRTRLSRAVLVRLAQADAFGSLGNDRRQALWEALGQDERHRPLPLFDRESEDAEHEDAHSAFRALPPMSPQDAVTADYAALGLSLRGHPLAFCRAELDRLGVTPASQLAALAHDCADRHVAASLRDANASLGETRPRGSPRDRLVKVAGLVLLRQRPSTAKGITFVTLEDETGTANLIVHQRTWEQFYAVARRSPAWLATGRLECKGSVIHVIVSRIEDLSARLGALRSASRDFR